ncbi:MAG: acetyl esterase [Candidatus Methanofastidiosum methylothiophilum]|uniref:Acetyl esterase n=1 Tax=Candidatus Methanofastidiosum methylothiophilum TaxID=1705564 RepID=A0A150IL64_9EURY|nr:MAG: acetyl esterase [Candidatus Methanofastidiosum methylthiophilus]KYC48006.1 MAG: acetyl esterase [Candidatus Methanofastidiosum methylthiophilus]KYC50696.1 MAG: acetyl esterase [Candidatus Methanofastidiosum methylthiophilus]
MRWGLIFFSVIMIMLSCCVTMQDYKEKYYIESSISKHYDIQYVYIKDVDPKLNSLDIYTKKSKELKPIMIYVHSGAWRLGDKNNVGYKPIIFTNNDFVFISINYRLSPNVKFPAHAQDVAKAIEWTYLNAHRYGGDKNEIYLMGHSAGAHLVSLVATDGRYLESNGLNLNVIKGVISLDAVYDLNLLYKTYNVVPDSYILTFGKNPEFLKFSSPITYVTKNKYIPPMLIVYSGGGIVGSLREGDIQSENFVNELRDANVYSELLPALDKSHMDINIDFGNENDYVTRKAFEFLNYVRNN